LVPLLRRYLQTEDDGGEEAEPAGETGVTTLDGWRALRRCVVSQAPIGRHKTSTPASYLGIWTRIRAVFARQSLAQQRGWTASHFSFNGQGACPTCNGEGVQQQHVFNLGYLGTTCAACSGSGYLPGVLDVTYRGLNIYDVLQLRVSEAVAYFEEDGVISRTLRTLERVGLGYLTLGQPAPTISGGEAQRLKLARELGRGQARDTLYILDEPTVGLGDADTIQLLPLLQELVDQGASMVVIEHHPCVLAFCDWIVELGPGGGPAGGRIVAQGTPRALRHDPASRIGPFLPVP
jgi:excinuclease UvrABC ATPase subunit